MTDHQDDADVPELLRRWADAERSADVGDYPSLLTADFQGIGPAGFVVPRERWDQRFADGLVNHTFEVLDPHIRYYGEDVAVAEARLRQETTYRGQDTSGSFRLGLVAVRVDGQWLLAQVQISGPLIEPGQVPSFVRPAGDNSAP